MKLEERCFYQLSITKKPVNWCYNCDYDDPNNKRCPFYLGVGFVSFEVEEVKEKGVEVREGHTNI